MVASSPSRDTLYTASPDYDFESRQTKMASIFGAWIRTVPFGMDKDGSRLGDGDDERYFMYAIGIIQS